MSNKINDYAPKDIIKFIRGWTGLTKKEFAESVDLGVETLEDYESGTTNFTFTTFMKICKKYGIEVLVRKRK